MRRLMIVAVATMLSVVANASVAQWSVDYTYQKGSTTAAEGWYAVFFDNAEVARDTFIASLATGDYADYVSTYGGVASDLTDEDGYADGYSKKTTYGNPESVTGYYVLFDSADVSSATYAYVSATVTESTGATSGQPAQFGFGDDTATQIASNWTMVGSSVPEPTSGLLMLLGVAGLALRRKRA